MSWDSHVPKGSANRFSRRMNRPDDNMVFITLFYKLPCFLILTRFDSHTSRHLVY